MSSRWKIVLILVAAAAVYLVGNARTQLIDRDEPRYAQCSRQMLQSGDWVVPRLYDQIRAAKPPGIYWCQAASMELFGDNAFAARVPSVLGGLLTAVLLATVLWRPLGPRRTVWTVFVFTTSALTIFAAKVCLTDSVLLLWTTISFVCVYLLWQRRGGWPAVLILSVAIGFGGLIKGPFILGVLGGTIVMLGLLRALDRWQQKRRERDRPPPRGFEVVIQNVPPAPAANTRRPSIEPVKATPTQPVFNLANIILKSLVGVAIVILKSLVGVAIVIAIVGPWVYLVQHREPNFLIASTKDAMEHIESGAEGHKGPPGYHLALIWVTFLPWSLLLPAAIFSAFRHRAVPEIRFALAAVLGTWILVEILQTKLPHYILAAFPALALLTADAIVRALGGELQDLQFRRVRTGAVIWGLGVLAAATVPWWLLAFTFGAFDWIELGLLTVLALAYCIGVFYLFATSRPGPALACMGAGMALFCAILFGLYLPRCQPLRLPVRIARVLREHDVVHPGQVKMFDYKEPSLAFYQGGTIREAKHSLAELEHFQTAPPWMVVTRQILDEAPASVRARLETVATFRGLNYSDALTPVEVLVVKKR